MISSLKRICSHTLKNVNNDVIDPDIFFSKTKNFNFVYSFSNFINVLFRRPEAFMYHLQSCFMKKGNKLWNDDFLRKNTNLEL